MNGFVIEILRISNKGEELGVQITYGVSLGIYIIIGVISIGYGCRTCTRQNRLQCINIIIKLFTFLGGICYFLGDNFHKIYKQDKRIVRLITLTFLVIGVLCYRIIPSAIKKLHIQKYLKDTKKRNTSMFNLCSPNDNETHSLTVAHTYLLTIVIDFDIWLTAVLQRADNNATHSLCNRMEEVAIVWSLYAGMITIFICMEVTLIAMFVCKRLPTHNQCKVICKKFTRIYKDIRVHVHIWDCVSAPGLILAAIAFLFADNKHPLDCYHLITFIDEDEPIIRTALLAFAFIVFFAVALGFYFRKLACCVKVKGEILSVEVLSDHYLQVYFKNKDEIGIHSFKYDISTSEIIPYPDCKHQDLYKSDIECIVKWLVGSGKLMAVNVQKDKIVVVHEIGGKIYTKLHYTDKSTKVEVYSSNTCDDIPQNTTTEYDNTQRDIHISLQDDSSQTHIYEEQSNDQRRLIGKNNNEGIPLQSRELIAMYSQNTDLYAIYLQQHGYERRELKVHVNKCETPLFTNFAFNVQSDQKVLTLEKLSNFTINASSRKFYPEVGHFDQSMYTHVQYTQ